MTDSKRQRIVDAIEDRMQTILVANGYNTDIGAKVFVWRATTFTDADLPAINLKDGNEPIVLAVGQWKHFLQVDIEIRVFETSAPAEVRKAIADVVKAIGTDLTFGGLIEDVTPPQRDFIHPTINEVRLVGAVVPFVFEYVTEPWNPDA